MKSCICNDPIDCYRHVLVMESSITMANETEVSAECWQATWLKATAARYPAPESVITCLLTRVQAEMMAKQLSAGEIDRLVVELLADLEETPQ